MSLRNLKDENMGSSVDTKTEEIPEDLKDTPAPAVKEPEYVSPTTRRGGPLKIKQVGHNLRGGAKEEVFRAKYKSALFLMEDDYIIQFVSHEYKTCDPREIEFLKFLANSPESPVRGEVFQGKFPEYITDKLKDDEQYLQKTPHEPELHVGIGKR